MYDKRVEAEPGSIKDIYKATLYLENIKKIKNQDKASERSIKDELEGNK